MSQSPFEFKLSEETQEKVEAEIMRRISAAVSNSSDRNQMLEQYADQLEGLIGASGDSKPWDGASDINDPLTMEQF